MHGDHGLGLPGLVSTLGMLKNGDLFIYGPAEVGEYVQGVIEKLFCQGSPFQMKFQAVDTNNYNLVMEDRSVSVYSLPMKHRVPCCGYLFVEKERSPPHYS